MELPLLYANTTKSGRPHHPAPRAPRVHIALLAGTLCVRSRDVLHRSEVRNRVLRMWEWAGKDNRAARAKCVSIINLKKVGLDSRFQDFNWYSISTSAVQSTIWISRYLHIFPNSLYPVPTVLSTNNQNASMTVPYINCDPSTGGTALNLQHAQLVSRGRSKRLVSEIGRIVNLNAWDKR